MEFYQIHYFQVLCETQSYTKAAAKLMVSQPTVSIAIRKLEDEFGAPLIDKTQKSFVLTSLGESFLERARLINDEIKTTFMEMQILANNSSDNIIVEFPECVCSSLLLKLAKEYIPSHPDDKIIVKIKSFSDILNDIRDQNVDISVICKDMLPENTLVGVKPFTTIELYAAVSFENFLSTYDFLPRSAYKDQTLLIPADGGGLSRYVRGFFTEGGVEPLYCSWLTDDLSMHNAYTLASENLGVALVDRNVLGLKCIPFEPPLEVELILTWKKITSSPSANTDNKRVKAKRDLIDFIISNI